MNSTSIEPPRRRLAKADGGVSNRRARPTVRPNSPERLILRATTAVTAMALAVVAIGCGSKTADSGAGEPRGRGVRTALDTLRSAFPAADPAPFLATFTDDVQLHSPALIGPEYQGRDVVAAIVTPAMQVLEDVRIIDLLETEDGAAGGVFFEARVGDQAAQGFVLLRAKGEQVSEITLLLRPLAALRTFVSRMGELGAQPALDARKGN